MNTPESTHAPARPAREFLLVVIAASTLAAWVTWPLARDLGGLGYQQQNGDGQWSVWNVGWVAHALTTNPRGLFDANIFYPHRDTLAYSEANIGAGLLGTPVFWLTESAFAAHNFALLCSFILSAVATYYLTRHLFGGRLGATVAAICFAYTPHVIAHLLHIQLLMTAGIPLCLLAFHRVTERPTFVRGVALGGAMCLQALFCFYYVVFMMLAIGYAVLVTAAMRRWWLHRPYWNAVLAGAVTAITFALLLFAPYLELRQLGGHVRPSEQSEQFSADWRAYFASSAYLHTWMLGVIGHWREVLFPGFVALTLGTVGLVGCARRSTRTREITVLYGGLIGLALWTSFGPSGALYRVLYELVPGISFMRAPSRFGLLVAFGLAVMTAAAVNQLEDMVGRRHRAWLVVLPLVALLDLAVRLEFTPVPKAAPVYRHLAGLPRGALVELPAYSRRVGFLRSRYMLDSTRHWMPLVNAYSDFIPPEFEANLEVIGNFPTGESLDLLAPQGVRYAIFHLGAYGGDQREALVARLTKFAPRLRRLYADGQDWLYEIVDAGPLQ